MIIYIIKTYTVSMRPYCMAKSRMESTKRGTCKVCYRSIAYSRMGVHLKTHISNVGKLTHYVIRVSDRGVFWMFLQVPGNHTLKRIDTFLRDEWLECCGHLSQFDIGGEIYDVHPSDEYIRYKSMNYRIRDVLAEKMVFKHEYDLGTPTTLQLTVTAARVPPLVPAKEIAVLAIHDKVQFNCEVCGGEAAAVCAYCTIYADGSMMCDDCIRKHECMLEEDAYVLNLVQSPRVGMCGFESAPLAPHN